MATARKMARPLFMVKTEIIATEFTEEHGNISIRHLFFVFFRGFRGH